MHKIAIIGAGTAGLHLALFLQKQGLEPTLITDRRPDEYKDMRLLNTVAHHSSTLARETELAVNHWTDLDKHYHYHDHFFNFPDLEEAMTYPGYFKSPSRAVDYRIYIPTLMKDFSKRGGNIQYRKIEEDDIPRLAKEYDLVVVCTGKGPMGSMFTVNNAQTPFSKPQRFISCGVYTGIEHTKPRAVSPSGAPGQGELVVIPMETFSGMQTALLFETLPNSESEKLTKIRYNENPKAFLQAHLDILEKYHPAIYNRVDTQRFDLAQPVDSMQGGLTPKVRETCVELNDDTFAVALGDLHATVDPVHGQGANIASFAAFEMGDEIVNSTTLDRAFVNRVDKRRNDKVLGAMHWTNLTIGLRPYDGRILVEAMGNNQALCDDYTDNFNYPDKQYENLKTEENLRAWFGRFRNTV